MPRLRLTPNRLLAGAGIVAAGLAAALIAVSLAGSGDEEPIPVGVAGTAEATGLLAGIPQQGVALGSPGAPVTLVEYADLQCPYCALWAREAFPELVRDYVRPGKVRVVFRGMAFIGEDSERGLRAALAAGAQNRLWHVLELLFMNQGEERSGWLTDDLLRAVGGAVPGLDVDGMLEDRDSETTDRALAAGLRAAAAAGITSTPSFEVGPTGGMLERLDVSALDARAFRPKLDELLAH